MVVPLLRAHPVECKPLPLSWAPRFLSFRLLHSGVRVFHPLTVILISAPSSHGAWSWIPWSLRRITVHHHHTYFVSSCGICRIPLVRRTIWFQLQGLT